MPFFRFSLFISMDSSSLFDNNNLHHFCTNGRQFTVASIKSDSDRAEAYSFMQNTFRVQEPITSAIQCTTVDTAHIYENICAGCFRHDVSLIARDSHGVLAGIALNALYEFDDEGKNGRRGGQNGAVVVEPKREFGKDILSGPYSSHNANRLATFIELVEQDMDTLMPSGTRRVLKLDILAVHPMFARLRLASHLLCASIHLAQSSGCSHLLTCATAVASQNLFKKFGFDTLRRVPFHAFLDNGVPIFAPVHDGGEGAELMMLEI